MGKRVVVIGGGITGLSAANRLVELSSEKKIKLDVLLLEGSNGLGGVISTKKEHGYIIEEGPDSFITTKPWALNLCNRIGLDSKLIHTSDKNRRTYVVHHGKLIPIPDGFMMLAPTRILPFLTTPLFSWSGKLRAALETVLPRKTDQRDESLASFVTRRLGREVLDRVAQPLICGIYTADPETLSLRATFPQFLEMETKHGSVIRAMLKDKQISKGLKNGESGARYSLFVSFKEGMQTLVSTLASRLPQGTIRKNQMVELIHNSLKSWNVITKSGDNLSSDGVIIALPSYQASKLIKGFDPSLASDLSKIQYESSAVINLAYNIEDISHPLEAFGFVVPKVESRAILACSFTSIKFPGRSPQGIALFRCFMGGALDPEILQRDDPSLINMAHEELCELLGIVSKPLLKMATRYPKSMPQYKVGHLELIEGIKEKVNKYQTLQLAGNGFNGVGIPDCIHSGESAAKNIFYCLQRKSV